uniref:Uncharacterized protein n=1 Tax=Timema poppense TaxID=170557 RepID=A0A7R9H0L7_TIMPO|nr:unnamed protein product [Timema poppensis]
MKSRLKSFFSQRVVKARNARGNFQLLIITHDHQFLEKLHSLDLLEDYFHVSRDARGRSLIKKKHVVL